MMPPHVYEKYVRPLLFDMDPEAAQRHMDRFLQHRSLWEPLMPEMPQVPTRLAGIALRNPIGLAAGYDKSCKMAPALTQLGFGYVTCGTITMHMNAGNLGVRLIRTPDRESLVNSFGLANAGMHNATMWLREDREALHAPVVVSIAGDNLSEVVGCFQWAQPVADAVELNISSPNAGNLLKWRDATNLRKLLRAMNRNKTSPIFVKLPWFPVNQYDWQTERVHRLIEVCVAEDVDALTVMNTMPMDSPAFLSRRGGLSGKPLRENTIRAVAQIRNLVGDMIAVNASGGIATAEDAQRVLDAGATTVQLLTSLVYRGPGVVHDIVSGLTAAGYGEFR